MKPIIITVLLAFVVLTCGAQIHYRLEGTIGDASLNTRLILHQHMSPMKMVFADIDTVEVVGGKLIPKEGTLSEAGTFSMRSITKGDEEPEIVTPVFIIEEGTNNIHFNPQKEEYKAPDTPLNKAFGNIINTYIPLLYGDAAKQQQLDSLMRSELSHHNDDVIGTQILMQTISHVNPATVASWMELMSDRVKAGDAWNGIKLALSVTGVNMDAPEPDFIPAIGEKFVDFAVEYEGKTTRLSDYVGRGKFVLADFWASWCGPCRGEIPQIIAAYEKYKDKGLEVVGIAAWDDPRNSLEAISVDGVPYPQILNTQKIAAEAYHVRGIPHIILFGPDGTIIARGLSGEALEQVLQNLLNGE